MKKRCQFLCIQKKYIFQYMLKAFVRSVEAAQNQSIEFLDFIQVSHEHHIYYKRNIRNSQNLGQKNQLSTVHFF